MIRLDHVGKTYPGAPVAAVAGLVTRAGLQREFLRLQRELGKTVVLVTHDIDEAVTMGDRIAILGTGSGADAAETHGAVGAGVRQDGGA